MATAVVARPRRRPPVGLTVDQYDFLIEQGRLPENPATELIGGQIVYKDRSHAGEDPMSIGVLHAWGIDSLKELDVDVRRAAGDRALLRVQLPIRLPPAHEPEPDGAVVRGTKDDYLGGHPRPTDVLCAIEVSDSSLEYDRTVKLAAYAEGGVPVYLIVNIPDRVLERHADPRPATADYATVETIRPGEAVRLPIGDGAWLDVPADRLLPPAT